MPPENSAPNVSRETYFRNLFQKYPDFDVSRETFAQLEIYHALLLKWQKAVNLVSPKTLNSAWERHFEDSAQISPLLPQNKASFRRIPSGAQKPESHATSNQLPDQAPNVAGVLLDFGSGAGFPGLVLAIMNPHINVHLVESDEKKCQFLKNVSRLSRRSQSTAAAKTDETSIENVTVHTCRIEHLEIEPLEAEITPDIITARALTDLKSLLEYCLPHAAKNPDLVMFFPKGGNAGPEIEEAQNAFSFDFTAHQSVTNIEAKILEIRNLKKLQ